STSRRTGSSAASSRRPRSRRSRSSTCSTSASRPTSRCRRRSSRRLTHDRRCGGIAGTKPPTELEVVMDIHDETAAEAARDEADLARFGYRQELRRSLGVFSSFAVAFSYISPSTGIFTLFALGLTTIGGVFIWSWPIVAVGQLCIALGFAELASHYPVAGSVFQWTKYLAGKTYSWFAGWIYM